MKKLLTLPALLMMLACNQKKISVTEVPSAVTAAFNAKYPTSAGVTWEKEKKGGMIKYEAKFKNNGRKAEAEFDSYGKFLKEEQRNERINNIYPKKIGYEI